MNLFNFIKSQLQIVQVINEYTTLKQAGVYWKGICPFHSEKTPSFTVSPHRDIFYCFGCHTSGDVISFIAKVENYSQIEAAKFLSERFSIAIPKEISKEFTSSEISNEQKDRYFSICYEVARWCHENLNKSTEALNYMTKRGFSKENISKYAVGYFPGGQVNIKSLLKAMLKQGILADDLIKCSIIMESKGSFYSPFEERIMFPISDQLGRFCGFGGRIFKENDDRAKYYNSHENSYFNKGSLLYGLDLAKKTIQEKGYAFLVEGYTDCIAMTQNGYQNSIAALGTACTIEHLKLLSRFAQKIYVLYDGDQAGQKAILRLTEMCWNVNMEVRVVSLLDKEDPASFLNKNGDLQKLVDSAKDIYSFFIESSSENFSTKNLNEKIWTVKKLLDIIRNIDDQLKRDILLQEIATKLNVPLESLKNKFESDVPRKNADFESAHDINSDNSPQERLFAVIINNFNLLTPEYYYLCDFFDSPSKEILSKLILLKEANEEVVFTDFWDKLDESEKVFVNKSLIENQNQKDLSANFKNSILQFQKKNWKNISHLIKLKLIQAQKNSDPVMINKIITEFDKLKKKLINGGCND